MRKAKLDPNQLDLFRDHPRSWQERVKDRQDVWQAYCDCLTMPEARRALPDVPEEVFQSTWPTGSVPGVPDDSLDRRRVMEAVSARRGRR